MARKRDMDQLQNEIQELFADLWQVPRFSGLRAGFRPQIDCYRTADPPELVVLVELPGVDPRRSSSSSRKACCRCRASA